MVKKQPKSPRAQRTQRLKWHIHSIYKERPELREQAPALVHHLAAVEYQADRVFADLEDEGLDARARQRLLDTWTRLTQMATGLRRQLGLDVPKDGDEFDYEADLDRRVEELDPIFLAGRYGPKWLIRHLRPEERALWIVRYGNEESFEARYGFKLPPTEWPEEV